MSLANAAEQIRNFHVVTPWLCRGGQPSDEQFKLLSRAGVKTIVSLRSGKIRAAIEKHSVQRSGMCFHHFPFTYFNIPDEEEIRDFLNLLSDPSNHPVFVHCLHGVDRTGFLIAVFRIQSMNWTFEQAYAEMKSLGFHAFRLPHFKWELMKFADREQRKRNNQDQLRVSGDS